MSHLCSSLTAQAFNTPEVVLTRSNEGLGGMSRAIHRLFLDRLLPRHWSDAQPPILLNSWEAKYFHVNHNNIVEMAAQVGAPRHRARLPICLLPIFILQASQVGINLIAMDDGWFGKREDATSSLGDWDLTKFPHAIKSGCVNGSFRFRCPNHAFY